VGLAGFLLGGVNFWVGLGFLPLYIGCVVGGNVMRRVAQV
jgi:hypothetical protein